MALTYLRLTVAGVETATSVDAEIAAPRITFPVNGRAEASFGMRTSTMANQPARFAEVIIYKLDRTTPFFGGVVQRRSVGDLAEGSTYLRTNVECTDFSTYLDWTFTGTAFGYTTGTHTLTQVLALIVALLTSYGITLDPSQDTGPSFTYASWDNARVSDVLRELAARTGRVYTLSAAKLLKMFVPGGDPAPYALTDAAPHCRSLVWQDSDRVPANKVSVQFGPAGVGDPLSYTWTGNGVITVFALTGVGVPASSVWPGIVNVNGVNYSMWGPGAAPGGNGIEWDWSLNDGTLTFLGTSTSIAAVGAAILLTYVPQYPFRLSRNSGASPVIEVFETQETITAYAAAVEYIDALLTQLNQQPRELVFKTFDVGWMPGQLLTVAFYDPLITSAPRLTVTAYITNVDVALDMDDRWEYTVSATESTRFTGSYLDDWRAMSGGASASSGGAVVLTGGTTVSMLRVALGGARNVTLPAASPGVPVVNYIPFVASASFSALLRVSVFARDAATQVKAHLYDETTAAIVASTSYATTTTPLELTVVAAITTGHRYHLRVQSDTGGNAGAIGQLESV